MEKKILLFGLFSSIGLWVLHLTIIPILEVGQVVHTSVGIYALTRQITTLLGCIIAGPLVDKKNPFKLYFFSELLQLVLASMLLGMDLTNKISPDLLIIWSGLRFFVGGLSFISGYKVLSLVKDELEKSSVMHLLMVQGAGVFGALVAIVIPYFSSSTFRISILFDLLTSFGLILILKDIRKIEYTPISNNKYLAKLMLENIHSSVVAMFKRSTLKVSIIQILILIMTAGLVTSSSKLIFVAESFLSKSNLVAGAHLIYGIMLWLTGVLVSKSNKTKELTILSVIIMIVSSLLGIQGHLSENSSTELVAFILYISSLTLGLHSSNRLVLSKANKDESGVLRASMIFYLSIIFGVGEILYEKLFLMSSNFLSIYIVRLTLGIILIVMILKMITRKGSIHG